MVSRYMNDPSMLHLKDTQQILKGTINFDVHYSNVEKIELVG